MKERIYIVTMYRYANKERHSYVLGGFNTIEKATTEAEIEKLNRGGNKYFPEIKSFQIDNTKYSKIEMKLPNMI